MGNDRVITPLLYIEQPNLDRPLAYMQQSYYGTKVENNSQSEIKEESVATTDEYGEKRFERMSVEEKIAYLLDVPEEVPPLKCVIYTREGNFQGIITAGDETTVTIKRFGRHDARVNKGDIVQIKLIGF